MFTVTYRAQLAMLNRYCVQSLEATQLMDEVLGGQPINVRGNRGKRQVLTTIAAGVSLLLSGYNTYELQRISSEVSTVQENQHHLVKAVQGLTQLVKRIDNQQKRMRLDIRSLAFKSQLRDFEGELINLAQTSVSYAEEQLNYLKEIHEGIYDALAQRLSPKLIEPQTMRDALTSVANQAITHGYSTLAQVVLHLFELPVSIYRTKNGQTLDIFVHVPLYEVALRATLWKREQIPFPLPDVLTKEGEDHVTHTVWNIASTNEIVAEDEEKSTTSFPNDDLQDCIRLGEDYYCRKMIRRRSTIFDSCELAVFHHSTDKIKTLCQLSLLNMVETAIPITTRRTLLFAKEQQLDITCKYPQEPSRKEETYHPKVSGLAMITLPEEGDCICSSLHHFWRNDPGITTLAQPQVRPINLNASSIFRYSLKEMNDYLTQLGITTYTETSIEEIEKTIDEIKLTDKGHVFGISTMVAGGIFLVAIVTITGCLVWQRRRVTEMISRLNPRKGRGQLGEADHAQAIGLLFKNGRNNRQIGPFNLDEGEEVTIRCPRDVLDNFLGNFDSVKLQRELMALKRH